MLGKGHVVVILAAEGFRQHVHVFGQCGNAYTHPKRVSGMALHVKNMRLLDFDSKVSTLCRMLYAAPANVRPGCVIGVPTLVYYVLPIRHVGIVVDMHAGSLRVVHASRIHGAVVETYLTGFADNARGAVTVDGYPSDLPADVVIARARERLGTPYDWRRYNCEHLCAEAHGIRIRSPQWEAWQARAMRISSDPYDRQRKPAESPMRVGERAWKPRG